MKRVSIVTPIYNEEENVSAFYDAVSKHLREVQVDWEIIYCVDPGTDQTVERIRALSLSSRRIKMLLFSKRIGQDLAISAGINQSGSDGVIIMDCDFQDPPSVLPEMINEWLCGTPMVIGRRKSRQSDPILKKLFSRLFYKFLQRFSDTPFYSDAGDFRIIDRSVINEFLKYSEQKPFVRGIFSHIAPRHIFIEFDRPERNSGTTKYNTYLGGYKVAINAVVGFSDILLRFSLCFGLLITFVSLIFGVFYFAICIYSRELPTEVSVISTLVGILGGSILIAIGVQGLYISNILTEAKARPKYFISETIGF